jgi:anti-sigma factor RsiW
MATVTREVVSDLWPLYHSGEASADTRRLVEAFLADDPDLAARLRETSSDPLAACQPPVLSPDHEMRTLARLKQHLWGYPMFLRLALIFSCLAFGRIVADTSWDVSPRNFIITAAIAAVFWVAFAVSLFRGRRALLVRPR